MLDRWPGLARLPRIPLLSAPTPITHLAETSRRIGRDVFAKRDDQTATPYGGNKVRKLEWLLGAAREAGADTLVTTGGYGSHHCLATALYGTREGFDVHAVVFPQSVTPHVDEVLRAMVGAGAELRRVPTAAGVPLGLAMTTARLRLAGKKPFVIGPGGSSLPGPLGYVAAGVELATQIDDRLIPEPAAIFVAGGTGGTVAGLSAGLAAAGLTVPVVGVRVTSRAAFNRPLLSRAIMRVTQVLRSADDRFPQIHREAIESVVVDGAHLGDAYGEPTADGERATSLAAEDGLVLDPTYTAKALAALLDAVRDDAYRGPLLFLSTLSSAPMAELLASAPATHPFTSG